MATCISQDRVGYAAVTNSPQSVAYLIKADFSLVLHMQYGVLAHYRHSGSLADGGSILSHGHHHRRQKAMW